MINRSETTKQEVLNIVGSSTFGRDPKISIEKTYNMYMSDNWMVNYGGYKSILKNLGVNGRAIFTSTILNKMIAVIGNTVYSINVIFNPLNNIPYNFYADIIGHINTYNTNVYIAENNAGQIAISDSQAIWVYDPNGTVSPIPFQQATIDFIPGYITFHDTYIIAASLDTNEWRLSESNNALSFPNDSGHVGLLETKPDNVVAVQRFPSRGNMIFVFGSTVVEPWFDVGYQLFPYQRSNSINIDYGCINPATIAATDELVVWLAQNEKSGPIIVASDGGTIRKITTDGIDYLFSTLSNPADSSAFIYRQAGHLFYHINFYTDNISLFYDFNTDKFYHASDENMNYFIANDVAFFNNQYYFVSRNNGNIYAFSLDYSEYDGAEVPRIRVCKAVRFPTQEYFLANDAGFTIQQGIIPYQQEVVGVTYLITQDDKYLITEGSSIFFVTQDGKYLLTQNGSNLVSQQSDQNDFSFLVINGGNTQLFAPRVDMCFSTDGGYSFGNYITYELNPLGLRRNMLRYWGLGIANDFVAQFRFWGFGKFVATDGYLNIRQ